MSWEAAYEAKVKEVRETGEGYTEPEMFRAGYNAGHRDGYVEGQSELFEFITREEDHDHE